MAKRFVFGDESDWNEGPWCIHAGWIAADPTWQRFERAWKRVLAKKGVEKVGFHSADFFNRTKPWAKSPESKNPYKDWGDDEAIDFLDALLDVVKRHKIFPAASAVDVSAFKALTKGERKYLTGARWNWVKKKFQEPGRPKHAYHVSLWGFIGSALDKTGGDNVAHFLMDRHNEMAYHSQTQFDLARAEPILRPSIAKKMGTFGNYTGEKPQPEGLQAADLYAYLWGSHFRLGQENTQEREQALQFLVTSKAPGKSEKMRIYDAEVLERILDDSPYRSDFRDSS